MRILDSVCSGTSIDYALYERESLFDEVCRQFMREEAGIDEQVVEVWLILVSAVVTTEIGIVFVIAPLD